MWSENSFNFQTLEPINSLLPLVTGLLGLGPSGMPTGIGPGPLSRKCDVRSVTNSRDSVESPILVRNRLEAPQAVNCCSEAYGWDTYCRAPDENTRSTRSRSARA